MDNLWYTYLSMGLGDVGWLPVNPGLVAPRAQWLRSSLGACWATTVRTMEKKTSQTFPPPQNSRWGRSFPHSLWSCSYLGNWCWKRICGECTDPPSRWVTGLAREKHWDQIRSRIQPVSQLVPRQQADLQNQRIQTENVQDQLASQDLHRSNFISFPIYGIHMYIISVCVWPTCICTSSSTRTGPGWSSFLAFKDRVMTALSSTSGCPTFAMRLTGKIWSRGSIYIIKF